MLIRLALGNSVSIDSDRKLKGYRDTKGDLGAQMTVKTLGPFLPGCQLFTLIEQKE